MAHVTPQERLEIERNPLGDSISVVRDALCDAELAVASQGGPDAYGADEPGRPRLYVAAIGKLLSILSASDVSLTLASRTGRDALASDLTAIRVRVQKGDVDHKVFRTLSQLVIKQETDVKIWEAAIVVILSITQSTPPPSLPPSFDTPITHSSASQQGSEQTRGKIEPRVFEEIRHCTYRAVEGFHEKYFEGRPWSRRAKRVYKASQHYYDNEAKRWKIEGATEEAICDWWLRFQGELLDKEKASFFRSSGNKRVGGEAQRQLDLLVKANSTSGDKHDWKDVLVIGELKEADKKNKTLWLQVGSAVRHVFAHQPTRRFVHAFTLTGTEMETWVFDRSGPFSGTAFDIHDEPEKFIQVLCGYLMMSDEELGNDTFTKRKNNKLFVTIPAHIGSKKRKRFELHPVPIASQRAIVCRGTSCFLAKTAGADDFDTVLKFSWASSMRPPEADLLNKAHERGVKGVATVVGYQPEVTSIARLRENLTFSTPHKFRGIPRSAHTSFSQSQSQISRSFSQLLGLSIVSNTSQKRSSTDTASNASKRPRSNSRLNEATIRHDAVTYPVQETQATSLDQADKFAFPNRILRILAISPAGRSVSQFASLRELLEALHDAILVHRSLLLDSKILHRDISENNIIITDPQKAKGARGMLIDLDLAKEDGKGPSGARYRTGTMEFMAIEVLLGISHTYRHDLESFFYVLLWACARRSWELLKRPKPKHVGTSKLRSWYTGTYEEIADSKIAHMSKGELKGFGSILREFPPEYESIKPLCKELRGILFPIRNDELFTGTPQDPNVLYGPIIDAFNSELTRVSI